MGDAPGLALVLDLSSSDGIADRLLARDMRKLADAARRTSAIKAMGVARFAAALRLRPVREDPSVFVAVRDRVLDAEGAPPERWIGVPPHVARAREAVAWSFGMGEAEYRSMRET